MNSSNHDPLSSAATDNWLPMKSEHLTFLASERWAKMLELDLLPWLLAEGELGDHVLELGPGPGLTTDLLRKRAPKVTAVELDPSLAEQLQERIADPRVEVVKADAAGMPFADSSFSAVACFHMLHHVPSEMKQDAVFAEIARVLRPGGSFLCADALDIESVRSAHREQQETFVPLNSANIGERLRRCGFRQVEAREASYQLLVRAVR